MAKRIGDRRPNVIGQVAKISRSRLDRVAHRLLRAGLTKVEPEFQDKVRNNVVLAGGTSLISGLADAVTKALNDLGGGRATVVTDPVFAGSDGSLAIARDASSSDWERLSL